MIRTNLRTCAAAVAILGSVGLLASTAGAAPQVAVSVDDRSIDPDKDEPPDLVARVVSGQAPPPIDKIFLVETDMKKGGELALPATDLKTYVQGDETLGIAVVFETQHLWLGNDTWWSKERSKTEGFYKPLTAALDKLAAGGPPGSKGALVSYGAGGKVMWQGELKDLTGDKIGTQRELTAATVPVSVDNPDGLAGVVQQEVAAGVDEAIGLLNKMGVSRKVLLIIGDGRKGDTIADYKKKLSADEIECYAIGLQALLADQLEGDPNGWKKIAGNNAKWIESSDGLATAVGGIVDGLSDRYYLRFAGADIKAKKTFLWDENPHAFSIRGIDKKDVELSDDVVLSPAWIAPWLRKKKGTPWYYYLAIPIGAILLVVIGVKLFKKKPEPEPVFVPAPVAAAPPPPSAPAPAGPMKTIMIGVGGDDQGFPIVGWIVPLNGPNQFQTFKLQPGATKIGTGGTSHVVVNDGFMSTEHAQIVMSPAGFTLVDGGSTNGTLVNDRRVDKHELVDNDTFLMGKTTFRFKSIN
jgi:hypothetical protein